jgi:hypothetical protein
MQSVKEAVLGGGPLSANVARMVIESFKKIRETPLTKRERSAKDDRRWEKQKRDSSSRIIY